MALRQSLPVAPRNLNAYDLEDLYLAEQRLIDIQAGKSETVPLEEVIERYGLESRD